MSLKNQGGCLALASILSTQSSRIYQIISENTHLTIHDTSYRDRFLLFVVSLLNLQTVFGIATGVGIPGSQIRSRKTQNSRSPLRT